MATNILPIEYQTPPLFPHDEVEDLIMQAFPGIEDHPKFLLKNSTSQLQRAIDKALTAYRQSIYLAEHADTLLPLEQWQVSEMVSENYRAAFHAAEASRTVARAFHLFLQRMDIEEIGEYERILRT